MFSYTKDPLGQILTESDILLSVWEPDDIVSKTKSVLVQGSGSSYTS